MHLGVLVSTFVTPLSVFPSRKYNSLEEHVDIVTLVVPCCFNVVKKRPCRVT